METADEHGRFNPSVDFLYKVRFLPILHHDQTVCYGISKQLFQSAFAATEENWRINRMADVYVKISGKFFMPPLMVCYNCLQTILFA